MSYRIYAIKKNGDNYQAFGNNECPEPFLEELKKQGCDIDEDSCFDNFKVKEIQPLLEAIEKYIMETAEWSKNKKFKPCNIFDLTLDEIQKENITMSLYELHQNAYIFVGANIIRFFEDDLDMDFDISDKKLKWKIKEGHEIYFSGY